MSFIAGILTFVVVINCLLLIFLVLIQLPKKDAGAGLAFGAGTADALFGAGSGNALTKITKWGTVVFLFLALVLGYVEERIYDRSGGASEFARQVQEKQMQTPAMAPATPPQQSSKPAAAAPMTNLLSIPLTNAPAATTPAK